MEIQVGPHLGEAELEQYSMGELPEARIEAFEEHFLACDACQDRLLEMESFVNAMRTASPKLRAEHRPVWSSIWHRLFQVQRPAWAAAFAVTAVAVMAGVWIAAPPSRVEMVAVELEAARGVAAVTANAPAGKLLSLKVDLTELPKAASYRMEVVTSTGTRVWNAVTEPRNGGIAQPMKRALGAGQYYVRLYAPEGTLLREFSLKAN
jgi:hypothetical protein